MAANGTGSIVFINDVMTSEVYRNITSVQVQPNASNLIGRRFTLQQDNDPKHTAKATKKFFRAKKCNVLG
uniref:Tc1-like transposase DDE domain-containing protein n=1 Tax=Anguilla anguilla TaxID=7936 RepID=A0A0E9TAX5_ANGAN